MIYLEKGVWAANDPALKEKFQRWNADMFASSDGAESELDDVEEALDIMDTSDDNWKQVLCGR